MKLKHYLQKSPKETAWAMIIAAAFSISAGQDANAQSFGINFLGNTSDAVTGTAGVVPIAGWNNIASSFTSGTVLSSDSSTAATLALSGALPGDGGWHSGSTPDGGNGSLVDGYLDMGANNGGAGIITLSGLAGSSYNIYLYIYSDTSHPGNSGDLLANYAVNGTTYYAPQLGNGVSTFNSTATSVGGPFTGFVQATTYGANFNTATANASDFGNYIEVANVAPVGGVITITPEADTTSWRSPLDGVEVVQAVPEASWACPTFLGGLFAAALARRRSK
jgi:hypothetical protein